MDKDILNLQEAAKKKFDELLEERKSHTERIKQIDEETLRLQGEYRAYEGLLPTEEKDEANTITVEEPDGE